MGQIFFDLCREKRVRDLGRCGDTFVADGLWKIGERETVRDRE